MRLYEGGDIFFRLLHIVERRFYNSPNDVRNDYDVVWESSQTAPILSAMAEVSIHDLLEMWSNEFRKAIEVFINYV
jgi:hypothetical protein